MQGNHANLARAKPAAASSRSRPPAARPVAVSAPPTTVSAPPSGGVASSAEHHHGACACGGTCPKCASANAAAKGPLAKHNFNDVRVHPTARNVTEPLQARAVTIGQDVYFHPGEYRPGTPEGDSLIAHELAHTLQTRRAPATPPGENSEVSEPDDALEENASALAHGETHEAAAAPAGAALRSPFDAETAEQSARRQTLITSIGNATETLLRLLRTGGLLQREEVAVERGGVRGVVIPANTAGTADEAFSSYAQRDARLRRIIRFLQTLGTQYRSAPIAPEFAPPQRDDNGPGQPPSYSSSVQYTTASGGVNAVFSGGTPDWADLQGAYSRYLVSQGLTSEEYELDWYYLDPSATVVPGAARGAPRISNGIQTGAYMVVPDIEHEPLRYWRLDGFSPTPEGSVIVEFWHDDFGYYYMHNGHRIDVPSPWSSDRGR